MSFFADAHFRPRQQDFVSTGRDLPKTTRGGPRLGHQLRCRPAGYVRRPVRSGQPYQSTCQFPWRFAGNQIEAPVVRTLRW